MSTLHTAMNNTARTANDARTNYSSLNPCLDLFFVIGAARGEDLTQLFEASMSYDVDKTIRILLWARDIRQGAGERQIFRELLTYINKVYPEIYTKIVLSGKIHELGRWDDYLHNGVTIERAVVSVIGRALADKEGLCAKWMPRKGEAAAMLRQYLGMTPKQYRKTLVSLSKTVEQQMCANQWENINYEHVPSVASARYQKAFTKHDEKRYKAYREALARGEAKINASAIFPHDVVKSCVRGDPEVAQSQWNSLPNYLEGSKERILPVCDVSGSMGTPGNGHPIDMCIALGLYLSERNKGHFKDEFITFSANPRMHKLQGTLRQRISQLYHAEWGMNTSLQAVFNLILEQALRFNIPAEEMPSKILILSDMEFDSCVSGHDNLTEIQNLYEKANFKLPQLVFWNLNGRVGNVPITRHTSGAALISGYSPSIMGSVLGGEVEPETVMNKTVMVDRYKIEGL